MGWGDEIIAAGQAREINERTGEPVCILGKDGHHRWSEIWNLNPRICQPGEHAQGRASLVNGPGERPYIEAKTERRWTWRDFKCPVGEIHFTPVELDFARRHPVELLIEPAIKKKASPNKDWGWGRWLSLAVLLRREGVKLSQIGDRRTRWLPGVASIETPTFRHACAVLATARAAVLPEGGLHHAAAAVGVRSVVIYGGYISPRQTGYALHENLFTGEEPCGMRVLCGHCAKAMAAITPEEVAARVLALLGREAKIEAA